MFTLRSTMVSVPKSKLAVDKIISKLMELL